MGGLGAINQSTYTRLAWGSGNFDADPLFVDPANGDYHLQLTSPCIDTGDPGHNPTDMETDFDGGQRLGGVNVDVGADETPGQ